MYEIFEKLLKERGITAYRVSKDTGISTATLTDWKKGRSSPKSDKLQKIADYFHVSVDYLLGQNQKNIPADESSEDLKKIEKLMNQLTPENRNKAMDYIDLLLNSQDKK